MRQLRIGQAFSETVRRSPFGYTQLMLAVDFAVGPTYEVVIVGEPMASDTKEMLATIHGHFAPNKVVVLRPTDQSSPEIDKVAPFIEGYTSIDGKATAYVCVDYMCELPTNDINTVIELLNSK